jgi:CheY-like chemotaxis protein
MTAVLTSHISSDNPRVLVVDGSKVARRMIEQVLKAELPNATLTSCETGAEAKAAMETGIVDLVTTALHLPDMDGLELARHVREHSPQAYIPIIVVSGSVNERLESRGLSDDVTDYFDKSLGFNALATFIRGYVSEQERASGAVLYVEDSRVVALATRRMLEKYGLSVTHVTSVEDAFALLDTAKAQGLGAGADIILTDVYLKGGLTGKELLETVRGQYGYSRGQLPILVMTADDNPRNQTALIRAGANDLVNKPVEEKILITKLMFQLRVSKHARELRNAH